MIRKYSNAFNKGYIDGIFNSACGIFCVAVD